MQSVLELRTCNLQSVLELRTCSMQSVLELWTCYMQSVLELWTSDRHLPSSGVDTTVVVMLRGVDVL